MNKFFEEHIEKIKKIKKWIEETDKSITYLDGEETITETFDAYFTNEMKKNHRGVKFITEVMDTSEEETYYKIYYGETGKSFAVFWFKQKYDDGLRVFAAAKESLRKNEQKMAVTLREKLTEHPKYRLYFLTGIYVSKTEG